MSGQIYSRDQGIRLRGLKVHRLRLNRHLPKVDRIAKSGVERASRKVRKAAKEQKGWGRKEDLLPSSSLPLRLCGFCARHFGLDSTEKVGFVLVSAGLLLTLSAKRWRVRQRVFLFRFCPSFFFLPFLRFLRLLRLKTSSPHD